MPVWKTAPQRQLDNTLDELVAEMDRVTSEDPAFSDVVGIDTETMMGHAKNAIAQYLITLTEQETPLSDPDNWIRVYVMGFVIGARYGRNNPL